MSDADFPYGKFLKDIQKLSVAESTTTRRKLLKSMQELSADYILTFIDKQQRMPALEQYYTMEFWDAVHDAELKSGLATTTEGKVHYPDDVFQVASAKQRQRYHTYIAGVREAIVTIISHALLAPHVHSLALQRFDVLFSGYIYKINLILMTTGLIAKFEDLSDTYGQCFREVRQIFRRPPHH
jgi:hypothetical protein